VYRTADSVMISAAKRGCFEAPGIRDTRMIRVTIRIVDRVVVPTDRAYEVTSKSVQMVAGIQAGYTRVTKNAIPVAESPCQ
jgi:hypothetical protein